MDTVILKQLGDSLHAATPPVPLRRSIYLHLAGRLDRDCPEDGSSRLFDDPYQRPSWWGGVDPISALVVAAAATTTLQLGTHVLANDFRNPVMLAQQVATLDIVSGERFQFGIGTGYNADDYAALGISLDSPGARVGRLEEAVTLIKRLFHEETVTFSGSHYTTHNALLNPKPTHAPASSALHRRRGKAHPVVGWARSGHRQF